MYIFAWFCRILQTWVSQGLCDVGESQEQVLDSMSKFLEIRPIRWIRLKWDVQYIMYYTSDKKFSLYEVFEVYVLLPLDWNEYIMLRDVVQVFSKWLPAYRRDFTRNECTIPGFMWSTPFLKYGHLYKPMASMMV